MASYKWYTIIRNNFISDILIIIYDIIKIPFLIVVVKFIFSN